jgi:DNA helicase HerA-like ATPase
MENKIQKDSIFKVGRVISVDGRTVRVSVDKSKNSANLLYNGDLIKNVSVNSYIKIIKGFTKIIGKVEGEFTDEDKAYSNKNYGREKDKVKRVLNISLLGFFGQKGFERGIKELPLIDNLCFLLDSEEHNLVHDFIKNGDSPLEIGRLTHEKGLDIKIGINGLFASHIGIFGNTGSGKSYTLAKIYNSLFTKYSNSNGFNKNAKFFLIDFNGEYCDGDRLIDSNRKSSFRLSTMKEEGIDHFPVSEKGIRDYTFWALILEATEKTQLPFIRRALSSTKIKERISNNESLIELLKQLIEKIIVKEDKNLKFGTIEDLLAQVGECFEESNFSFILSNLHFSLRFHNKNSTYYYVDSDGDEYYGPNAVPYVNKELDSLEFNLETGLLNKIRLTLVLKYHDEIINGFSNIEHLSPLINRIGPKIKDLSKLIVVNNNPDLKNICIVSLREVNVQMRKMLPFLICKQMYEEKKEIKIEGNYLNIIIDEAHNILSEVSERESETWKDYRLETFEEIIKEGRKFGVFLTIASQRPSDISSTIISQLHNFFLHRLINNNDIKAVEKSISYLDKLSFESLPILPTGTCIFAGLAAQVPVMIDIGTIEEKYEPDNKTLNLTEKWTD